MLDTVYSPEVCEFSTSCRQRARLKIDSGVVEERGNIYVSSLQFGVG